MSFVYSEEQNALRELFKKSLQELCTSDFLRSYREDVSQQQKLIDSFTALGFFDFVEDESCTLQDLTLIAKECGWALCSMQSFYRGYIQHYLPRRCSKIDQGAFEFKPQGLAYLVNDSPSFLSDSTLSAAILISPGSLVRNSPVFQLARIDSVTVHPSIDISEASFSGKIVAGSAKTLPDVIAWTLQQELSVLLAAELSGIGKRVLNMTQDYVKTRRQYGAFIGSFQAVQHQLAECLLKTESCWALVECAAITQADLTDKDGQASFASRSALIYAAQHIPEVIETCLQLHGGIGFTWEHDIHLYLRKALKIAALIGVSEQSKIDTLSLVS